MATGTMKVRAVADMSQLTRAMNKAQGRVQKFAGGMKRVGGAMTKTVTPAVAGLGAMALKTASDFESSMKRVQALTGSTGKEFKGLEGLAKDLGRTTQFSASEAAEGMGFLAQAGFETDEIMSALPGTLNLAAAGQLELAEAADIASNVLTGYGLEADEINRVNDVLAKTSTSANTDVRQLGEAFSLVAPVAKSSGLAFEETNAILGMLGDAGIQASRAGTTLRGMLAALESPSTKAAKALSELGIKTHDAEGNMLPMVNILTQFEAQGLSTADAMTIFGRRAGPGMAALVSQGAAQLKGLTKDLKESGGTAKEIADKQMEGLRGAMLRLKAALEGVAISIADSGLLDWATGLAEKFANLLGRVAKVNPKLLKVGVIVAGVAAAIGPLLLVLGGLIASASALVPVLAGAAAALSLPVVAIGALVAALVVAYTKSETFRDIVNRSFDAVRDMAMDVWPQVRDIIETVLDIVKGAIRAFVAVAEAVWRTWGETIVRFAKEVFERIGQIISGVLDFIGGLLEVFAGLFSGDWDRMLAGVEQMVSGWKKVVAGIFGAAFAAIRALLSVFRKAVTSAWSDLFEAVKRTVSSALRAVTTWFRELPGRLVSAAAALGTALKGHALSQMGMMFSGVREVGSSIAEWFSNLPDRLVRAMAMLGGRLGTFVRRQMNIVWDQVKDVGSSIISWFKDLPGNIVSALGDLGSKIKSKFTFDLPGINFSGDGPGMGAPDVGGKAAKRAAAAAEGLPIRQTSGYRTPSENAAVGGSPTSYHLVKDNPATDWGGPSWALDLFAERLRAMGGWRELLWRTAGHYDHVHVAHSGGTVTDRGIDPLPGELLVKAQRGETIFPAGTSFGGDGDSTTAVLRRIERRLAEGQTIQVDREVLGEVVREEFRRMDRDNVSAGLP